MLTHAPMTTMLPVKDMGRARDGLQHHGVARLDGEDGRERAQHVVPAGGNKGVSGHVGSRIWSQSAYSAP